MRADAYPIAQQIPQALHDGETEAKAPAPFARGIVELMVLLRRSLEVPRRGCRLRCPRSRCSAFLRADGNRVAPYRAWCISMRSKAGCGSSARADADHCVSKGRTGPRARQASVLARDR